MATPRHQTDHLLHPVKARPMSLKIRAIALLLCGVANPAFAETERLSILANGEIVGSVTATVTGNRTAVEYRVDDNGRGPKHHEEIVTGPAALPTEWTVQGTSLMGGPVAERFVYAGGRATWSSQADAGSVATPAPKLYILNDDSPYAEGVYARAALAAKGHAIDTLPGGRLTITKLRDMVVATEPVTIYRLDGSDLAPHYVALDAQQRLFATLGGAIRTGFEQQAPLLGKLGAELERERIRTISARVTHRIEQPIRLRNVHVFDPRTGTRGPLSTIVTMRDRIVEVLPGDGGAVPADEAAIDGEGGTVYPGLHDMHSHTSMSSGLFYLAAGVTETREMGNDNAFLLNLMPRVESGEIAGPHIVANGLIEGRSPYSLRLGIVAGSLDEAITATRFYADHGYRDVKLYNSFNPDWVKPVADEAHRLGMGVTGHVPAFDTPDRVIADGYGSIAHINQLMLGWLLDPSEDTRTPLRLTGMARAAELDLASPRVQHTLALMQAHHTALDTTTVIVERLMLSRTGTVAAGDAAYLSHMPIGYRRYRMRTFVPLRDAAEDARYRKAFGTVIATMKLLRERGIQMLPGTDDATGFTVHRELELYVQSGMTPAEALRADTLDSATFLGQDTRGTIERGKIAEFVLVAGDPTRDISAIRKPRMVMRGGAMYFPSEIYAALGITPFATAPTIVLPKPTGDSNATPPLALFGYPDHDDAYGD
jgi:hypothetical protein